MQFHTYRRLQYLGPLNRNRRAVRNKSRAGRLAECFSELLAVESCNVCIKFELSRIPNFPSRMLHAILAAAATQGVGVPHTRAELIPREQHRPLHSIASEDRSLSAERPKAYPSPLVCTLYPKKDTNCTNPHESDQINWCGFGNRADGISEIEGKAPKAFGASEQAWERFSNSCLHSCLRLGVNS